jgi:hypothetical protein
MSHAADVQKQTDPAPAVPQMAPIVTENEKYDDDLSKQLTAQSHHPAALQEIRTREDGTEYPTGLKLGLIMLALCLAVFLMALE